MSIGWKSLITGLLVALISALIIYIVARIWYILSRKDKLHIKRLISPKDKDVSKLVEVYEDLIDANSISPQADIKRWLDEYEKSRKDPKHTLEEYWLVAKLADRIVGFLFFQYYLDSKFLFISYFGADKSFLKDTRVTSDAILAEFRKRLNKELKECRGIIYETESADGNLAERARIRKFKSYAKKLGFKAYEIGIDYMTPKLSIDPK